MALKSGATTSSGYAVSGSAGRSGTSTSLAPALSMVTPTTTSSKLSNSPIDLFIGFRSVANTHTILRRSLASARPGSQESEYSILEIQRVHETSTTASWHKQVVSNLKGDQTALQPCLFR